MESNPESRTFILFEGAIDPETAKNIADFLGPIATRTGARLDTYPIDDRLTDEAGVPLNPDYIQYVQPHSDSSDSVPVVPMHALIPHLPPQSPRGTKPVMSRALQIWNALHRKACEDPQFAKRYVVLAGKDENASPGAHDMLGIRAEHLAELVDNLLMQTITIERLSERGFLVLDRVRTALYTMRQTAESPTHEHATNIAEGNYFASEITPGVKTEDDTRYDTRKLNPQYCTIGKEPERPVVTDEHLALYARTEGIPRAQWTITRILHAISLQSNWTVDGISYLVKPDPVQTARNTYVATDHHYPSLPRGFVASELHDLVDKLSSKGPGTIRIRNINDRSIEFLEGFLRHLHPSISETDQHAD